MGGPSIEISCNTGVVLPGHALVALVQKGLPFYDSHSHSSPIAAESKLREGPDLIKATKVVEHYNLLRMVLIPFCVAMVVQERSVLPEITSAYYSPLFKPGGRGIG